MASGEADMWVQACRLSLICHHMVEGEKSGSPTAPCESSKSLPKGFADVAQWLRTLSALPKGLASPTSTRTAAPSYL